MRTFKNFLLLCFLAVLGACTEDAFVPQSEVVPTAESGSVDLVSMIVPDIVMNDAMTRSKLYEENGELKFTWQENDDIGVVPQSGHPLSFSINAENAGKNTALFDGGEWALKSSGKYAAFFPLDAKNQKTDIKHIAYSYIGQTQSNYSKYDFLATGVVQPSNGQVKFTMKRLSAILKIRITMPAESYGRYGALVASDAVFGVEGTLDLSGSEPVVNASYSKIIHTQIAADKTSSSEWTYEVIMMIPPTDLSGESLMFRIISDQGESWEAPLTGANFEAGKAYVLEGTADEAKIRNRNLIHAAMSTTIYSYQTDSEGNLCVNRSRTAINDVTSIDVHGLEDPTVCDEIGYFRNLETLLCYNKYNTPEDKMIASLDVSQNTALTTLDCGYNQLSSLDVSKNTALTVLNCGSNKLTSLDVSNNMALTFLDCHNNQLTSLNVSNNPELITLQCRTNQLTFLDVSNCTALTSLECYWNNLKSLDLSNCTVLTDINCSSNQLTSLDVSNNTALSTLYCHYNQITSLDVSNNTALKSLACHNNQLTSLDISNNTELLHLLCGENSLSELDVSNNPALTTLDCYDNQLTTITGFTNCTDLTYLRCYENPFTSFSIAITSYSLSKLKELDISNCTSLTELIVKCESGSSVSSLTKLNVSGCTALTTLRCYGHKLSSLNVSTCTALNFLDCPNNLLTSLDVSNNKNLTFLLCYKNLMSELNVRANTSLKKMSIFCGNQYTGSDKTTTQTLTLKARADDTTSLQSVNNSSVVVEDQ